MRQVFNLPGGRQVLNPLHFPDFRLPLAGPSCNPSLFSRLPIRDYFLHLTGQGSLAIFPPRFQRQNEIRSARAAPGEMGRAVAAASNLFQAGKGDPMVTRPVLALMGMLAVSLGLTGCKNCCSSWGCKDANCDVAAQARKLPPICDGASCSHGGHAPALKPTAPPAQANNWYNPPAQPSANPAPVNTPAVSNMRIPQTPTNPAPIAISQPANPATAGTTVRTTASPTANVNETSSAVTPASGTEAAPLRTWPGAESQSASESRPMPTMPERTGMDTPSAAPAPIAASPSTSTPMPSRRVMLPPATEATLPPVETSAPANPMMPAQPTRVETQYHEVPSSTRTPVELPPAAPELPTMPAAEPTATPAPAAENPLMLPPAEGR